MPANYDLLSSLPDVEFLGPTTSRPIQRVEAIAKPSGVVFHFSIPPDVYGPEYVGPLLDEWAQKFNSRSLDPRVLVISTVETVRPNNQLLDLIDVTYVSTSGLSQGDFQDAYITLEDPFWDEILSLKVAALDAVEAG